MPSTANDNDRESAGLGRQGFPRPDNAGIALSRIARRRHVCRAADPARFWARKQRSGSYTAEVRKISLPATERLSRSVEFNLPQIGDMPPEPPTLRGRMGAVMVGMVRRALFWYTAQIKTFHAAVADAARELAPALQNLDAQQRRQRTLIGEGQERIAELERRVEENQAALAAAASQPSLQDQFRQLDQAVKISGAEDRRDPYLPSPGTAASGGSLSPRPANSSFTSRGREPANIGTHRQAHANRRLFGRGQAIENYF